MPEKKTLPFMLIAGLLIAASTTAAFVSSRKHAMVSCKDLRIAMDGSYSAVVETGGLTATTELTIYQEHNRRRVKVDKVPVAVKVSGGDETATYVGERVKLVILNKTQPSTGRNIASLQGEVRGERVSATLSCAN
jgi:hypothetical protein